MSDRGRRQRRGPGPAEVAAGAAIAAARGVTRRCFRPRPRSARSPTASRSSTPPSRSPRPPTPSARSAPRPTPRSSAPPGRRGRRLRGLVAAGTTGAALAAGLFNIKRAKGIYRPALADPDPGARRPGHAGRRGRQRRVPARAPRPVRPHGRGARRRSCSASSARAWPCSPTARRPTQGHAAAQSRPTRCWPPRAGLDFVGNIEGNDVIDGHADVIVTDGFTGNVALKLIEGVSQTMSARSASGPSPRRGRSSAGC